MFENLLDLAPVDCHNPRLMQTKRRMYRDNAAIAMAGKRSDLEEAIDFFKTNKKILFFTFVIAVFVIAAVSFFHHSKKKAESQALVSMGFAKNIGDLEKVVSLYESTPSAPIALLTVSKAYFDQGDYDMALTKYMDFIKKYPKHLLKPAAELGRIHCIEARMQYQEALDEFVDFQNLYPDHFLKNQAFFGQTRCLEEMGRLDEARILYEDFIVANPDSPWLSRAEESLKMLKKKSEAMDKLISKASAGATDAGSVLDSRPVKAGEK